MYEIYEIIILITGIASIIIGLIMLLNARKKIDQANKMFRESDSRLKKVKQQIDLERREGLAQLKDDLYRKRKEFDLELKRDRLELDRLQAKINIKNEAIDKKEEHIDELRSDLQQRERNISRIEDKIRSSELRLKSLYDDLLSKLERVANMSKEEAKQELFDTLESEVRLSSQKLIQKIEEDANQIAKQKAIDITVGAMQRYTADQVSAHSSGVVHLPNEDMKGRIIGKEGRNIKALEMATGMEFVIGDTADITISGFNPIRREVARIALEKLVTDGRINPTRIEETVEQCEKQIDDIIQERGKEVVLEFNLQGMHPDIVTLLGKLHFRTSYSQNVLIHSKEVGIFARVIAQELGLDGQLALRAGLLHDIGKAVTAEVEGPHAMIGGDIARACGENPLVVNAIAAHHEEVVFTSVYAPIVLVADAISASRPGARRETLTAYVKRLEKLEEIANTFEGIKKAYALQAGREVRIIVFEDRLTDEESLILAREIARKIEKEMNFPGQIKVNVIREKRSIEYAR